MTRIRIAIICMAVALALVASSLPRSLAQTDPAAWGDDHVGKPLPEYITGGECLFCHRFEVGTKWQDNRHNNAMEIIGDVLPPALEALGEEESLKSVAGEVAYLVGDSRLKRFLKPNGRYGQAAMLDAKWVPGHGDEKGHFVEGAKATWDDDVFGNRCAGCHATAVETEYTAFSTYSNDCFVCHGEVPAAHNSATELALFAKSSKAGAVAEMSICASCHLRGGKSKSTGLPYANQFVPGDNLFRDFEVDLSVEHIAKLNPADKHVYESVRDVVINEVTELSCTACHDVHKKSTRKHRTLKKLARHDYCVTCHENADDYKSFIEYAVSSAVCEY